MGKIILENTSYSFDQIKKGEWKEADVHLEEALFFCQHWLQGQESFILHTSGSTGLPKAIKVKRSQMEISAKATGKFFEIKANPVLLCCLNTDMIAGKMMLVRAMAWDAEVYLIKPKENPLDADWLSQDFDFVATVPMQAAASLSQKNSLDRLKRTKTLIIGGAPTPNTVVERLIENEISAYQTYGMTETVSHIALAKIGRGQMVYKTLPDIRIGTDGEGRLWVEASMAKNERIQTNDLVKILDENHFQWLGRNDFTVNSGGIKIQPETLEPILEPFIFQFFGQVPYFVFGKEDARLGQKLVLVIESDKADSQKIEKLLTAISGIVDKYHIPKEVLFVQEFVKTPSGKINRKQTINSAK